MENGARPKIRGTVSLSMEPFLGVKILGTGPPSRSLIVSSIPSYLDGTYELGSYASNLGPHLLKVGLNNLIYYTGKYIAPSTFLIFFIFIF